MESEELTSLERRIENIEKSLGVFEDETFYSRNKSKQNIPLTTKLQFIEYKTKEIYMSQIKNLIEKKKELDFLLKNNDNIANSFDIIYEQFKIIIDNEEFLRNSLDNLLKINKTKKFIDSPLALLSHDNLDELKLMSLNNQNNKRDAATIEERAQNIINLNGGVINDLNSHIMVLDKKISQV